MPRPKISKSDSPAKKPTEDFEEWQLAEEVASSAEGVTRNAFKVTGDGHVHRASDLQSEVSAALRKTASEKLSEALAAYEKRRTEGVPPTAPTPSEQQSSSAPANEKPPKR